MKLRIRSVAVLVMGILAVSSAHAGALTVTISGTWGTFSSGAGISTTPYDNGSAFNFSTTITSFTPTFFNSGETQIPTTGGSYTNGAVTASFSGLEQLILTDPAVWNGQNFGFGVHDIYAVGDFMEFDFNGPQLFTGATSAPSLSGGSFQIQQALYGFSSRYLGVGASGYSVANLAGTGSVTLSNTPEPSTGILMTLALGAALLRLRARTAKVA